MKPTLLILALAICLSIAGDTATPGRFQIIAGRTESNSMIEGKALQMERACVFKLDTATGDTWIWTDMQIDGSMIQGWSLTKTLGKTVSIPSASVNSLK